MWLSVPLQGVLCCKILFLSHGAQSMFCCRKKKKKKKKTGAKRWLHVLYRCLEIYRSEDRFDKGGQRFADARALLTMKRWWMLFLIKLLSTKIIVLVVVRKNTRAGKEPEGVADKCSSSVRAARAGTKSEVYIPVEIYRSLVRLLRAQLWTRLGLASMSTVPFRWSAFTTGTLPLMSPNVRIVAFWAMSGM